jgi:methylated-DNA-[protein]-cysteine S-methyltransferase
MGTPNPAAEPLAAAAGAGPRARGSGWGAVAGGRGEIAYAVIDSPLGRLLLAATDRGLVRLAYVPEGPDPVLWDLVERISPRVRERPGRLEGVRRELDAYFAGRRTAFETPLDTRLVAGFRRDVLAATAAIPYGELGTYGEVARAAGRPGGARAAGGALGANPLAVVIPCHRVVRTGGALGGYGAGLWRKRFLLELEGALPPTLGSAPGR